MKDTEQGLDKKEIFYINRTKMFLKLVLNLVTLLMLLWLTFNPIVWVFLKVVNVLLLIVLVRGIIWRIVSLLEPSTLTLTDDRMSVASQNDGFSIFWKDIKEISVRRYIRSKGIFIEFYDIDKILSNPEFMFKNKSSPVFLTVLAKIYTSTYFLDIFMLYRRVITGKFIAGRKVDIHFQESKKEIKEIWELFYESYGYHTFFQDKYKNADAIEIAQLMEKNRKRVVKELEELNTRPPRPHLSQIHLRRLREPLRPTQSRRSDGR